MAELLVVLGGARSGKSALGERLAAQAGRPVVYVGTVRLGGDDGELAARVAAHRARRPDGWQLVEDTAPELAVRNAPDGSAVLVDGIGLWTAGQQVMDDERARQAGRALVRAARAHRGGPVVVVAEEAGMGVVPVDRATRAWVDAHGAMVQELAHAADRAVLVVAGRTVTLGDPADLLTRDPAAISRTRSGDGRGNVGLHDHGDTMVPAGALDLAVNVHGDGPPPHLRAVLTSAFTDLGGYPDPGAATAALAVRHGRDPAEVLTLQGAAEAFWLLADVLRPQRAVVVHPQFTAPEAALRARGRPVRRVVRDPAAGWRLDPGAIPDDADLVMLGNPNNPTGTLDRAEQLTALCRPGRTTVVDEAFMDFVPGEPESLAGRGDLPGLVVVRSVTKLWGLAGLRAGYLLGPPELVERCAAARQPWPVGGPALAALTACAADGTHREQVAAQVGRWREELVGALRRTRGVQVWDGAANFVLFRVADGPGVHAALLARGIAVRPSTFPGLDRDHLRVAVRGPEATSRLVSALGEILGTTPAGHG